MSESVVQETGTPATAAGPAVDDQGGPGTTTIAPRVVERLAVAAAREVDATATGRGGLGGLVRGRLPRASATIAGRTSKVEVQVGATWPDGLAGVAARVRDHVSERVRTLSGIEVTSVDVTVAEIVQARDLAPRVQ